MLAPTTRYSSNRLQAALRPEYAHCLTVRLAAGYYPKGSAVAQLTDATPADDVQTLTFAGAPAGSFLLKLAGDYYAGPVQYSATPAALQANIQAALDAALGAGTTAVLAASATSVAVSFVGPAAGNDPGPIAVAGQPAGGTVAVARTSPGRAASSWGAYVSGGAGGLGVASRLLMYTTNVDALGRHKWAGDRQPTSTIGSPAYHSGTFRTADCYGLDAGAITSLGELIEGSDLTLPSTLIRLR